VAFLVFAAHGEAGIPDTGGDIAMQPVERLLRSRQFALPLFCVLTSAALLSGLFLSGALNAEEMALLVFALYIGSKIFMLAAALWVAARHSPKFRRLLRRATGKLRFPPLPFDPRPARRTTRA